MLPAGCVFVDGQVKKAKKEKKRKRTKAKAKAKPEEPAPREQGIIVWRQAAKPDLAAKRAALAKGAARAVEVQARGTPSCATACSDCGENVLKVRRVC